MDEAERQDNQKDDPAQNSSHLDLPMRDESQADYELVR